MTDLTPMIEALIALFAAFVSAFLIPWLKERTTASQRNEMLAWVDIAVMAAQQLYHGADGKTRLVYALDVLERKGYDINDDVLKDAVEAAVLKLHQELEAKAA